MPSGPISAREQAFVDAIAAQDHRSVRDTLSDDFCCSSLVWSVVKFDRERWLDLLAMTKTRTLAWKLLDVVDLPGVRVTSMRWNWEASVQDDDLSDTYLVVHTWVATDAGWKLRARFQGGFSVVQEELSAFRATDGAAAAWLGEAAEHQVQRPTDSAGSG